jgi:hypothetical protein
MFLILKFFRSGKYNFVTDKHLLKTTFKNISKKTTTTKEKDK